MPRAKPEPVDRIELELRTPSGSEQFKGAGIVRSCIKCGRHRPNEGGRYLRITGIRHWACADCPPKTSTKDKT